PVLSAGRFQLSGQQPQPQQQQQQQQSKGILKREQIKQPVPQSRTVDHSVVGGRLAKFAFCLDPVFNQQLVNVRYQRRLPTVVPHHTPYQHTRKHLLDRPSTASPAENRGSAAYCQRGLRGSPSGSTDRGTGFLQPDVRYPQEVRRPPPGVQPQAPQPVHRTSAIQDGNSGRGNSPHCAERLHVLHRP
ncbi:hypothetical protein, partial, partial [Parasitella parasitica]